MIFNIVCPLLLFNMYTKSLQYNSAVALKLEHSLLQNICKQTKRLLIGVFNSEMCFNLFNAKTKLKMTCTYVYVKCKQEHFLYLFIFSISNIKNFF